MKSRKTIMELLSLRIEFPIRLQEYACAFKDAYSMARHDPADARGYICCGQLKRLQCDNIAVLQ